MSLSSREIKFSFISVTSVANTSRVVMVIAAKRLTIRLNLRNFQPMPFFYSHLTVQVPHKLVTMSIDSLQEVAGCV